MDDPEARNERPGGAWPRQPESTRAERLLEALLPLLVVVLAFLFVAAAVEFFG